MLSLENAKHEHIYFCLVKNGFNQRRTAKELAISDRGLRNCIYRMRALGYEIPERITKEQADEYFVHGMATNEQRLQDADFIINRNYL